MILLGKKIDSPTSLCWRKRSGQAENVVSVCEVFHGGALWTVKAQSRWAPVLVLTTSGKEKSAEPPEKPLIAVPFLVT